VIALGGGAVEDPRSRAALRNARVVYLRVSYDEALSRVKSDEFRPMLHRPDLDEVYKRRLPVYEDLSVLTVDTDGRRPDAIALDALSALTRLPSIPADSSSVFVTPVGGTYYAHIGPRLIEHVGALLPPLPEVERALIVAAREDAGVAARVGEQLAGAGVPAHHVALPDTQASKTFRSVEHLADVLADHAIHKDDLIVAVGGEAICDVTGFVASTFNRGMKLGLVPTTLVAQADSAVGGKNAINLGRGRNGPARAPDVRAGTGGEPRPGRRPAGHHAQHRDQGRHRQPGRAGARRPGGAELRPHVRARYRADPGFRRRGSG
jgi:3-dehydroquinate synthase/shikimate kinase/3-dehydroquinate synthase